MSRRRAFPMFPFMAASSESTGPFSRLSQRSQSSLLELAKILHEIDCAILNEAPLNKLFRKNLESYPTKNNLFNDFERDVTSIDTESPDELLKTLAVDRIGKYNQIWSEAAAALLQYQNGSRFSDLPSWSIAKTRARSILDLFSDAWEVYDFADELLEHNYQDLSRGLRTKFRSLQGFEIVYNQNPATGTEQKYYIVSIPPKKHVKNGSVPFSQAQQNRNATLVSVVFTATTLCIIPLFLASHHSTPAKGSTEDADFYLLIQNTLMQLLGLFTAMYPIFKHSSGHHWRWAQAFTIMGVLCSLSSLPLYIYTPTMWSAIASFFGTAAQAGMALLLALMVDWGNAREKQD